MNIRAIGKWAVLVALSGVVVALQAAPQASVVSPPQPNPSTALRVGKPNIVHILVDDLGWQDVACYYRTQHTTEPFYETPNIDRLAKRGIRFMHAYSPAMTCAPSRAAYMTGQFTPHNGVYHVNMGGRIPRAPFS